MLRRIIAKILWRLIILLLLTTGAIYFLLNTQAGTDFIFSSVRNYLPPQLQVSGITGELASNIKFENLNYDHDGTQVVIKSLAARWQFWPLLNKRLVIDDITLDGVKIIIKPGNARGQQSGNVDLRSVLDMLARLNLKRANFNDVEVEFGQAKFLLNGSIDTKWHIKWSLVVPALNQFSRDMTGKVISQGEIFGERKSPDIRADISLTDFRFDQVGSKSISGKILNNKGTLQVNELKIKRFQVPDFKIATAVTFNHNNFSLEAAINFNAANRIAAVMAIPEWNNAAGLNQAFRATAKAQVNDFSQFNTLFKTVPQVRQFAGKVTGTFTAAGTLMQPVIEGGLKAANGSVYIPDAAMKLQNISLSTYYKSGNKVQLSGTFNAGEGSGKLSGTLDIEQHALPLQLHVQADKIMAYDDRNYKIIVSPDINLLYENDDLNLEGTILVPYAKITPIEINTTATLPSDVVIVNQASAMQVTPTNITLQLKIILGETVKIRYHGLKTSLQGSVTINGYPDKPLTATGEFRLAKDGTFRAYGKQLVIQEGRLIYAGNQVTNPGISLRALQTVKRVGFSSGSQSIYSGSDSLVVGMDVSGTLDKPVISLFSDQPGLSQGDILSYLLFGYPQSQASGASSLVLLSAATDMMGGKENKNIISNLQQSLGLEDFSVGSTEYYDYENDASHNAATFNVGRSLGHNLSLHYSIGLFQPIQIFSLRYQINRHLVLQTETSTLENGGDLLYQLESRE
jgi:translocation and assembly module TamB